MNFRLFRANISYFDFETLRERGYTLDYFDEIRRMQRIFDQGNAVARAYRDMDLASKLSGSSLQELPSILGRAEVDPSLAAQFRSVIDEAKAYFESPAYKITSALEEQLRQDQVSLNTARLDLFASGMLRQSNYEDWYQTIAKATKEVLAGYDLARSLGISTVAEEITKNANWIRNVQAAASPVLSMLANEFSNSMATGGLNPALIEGFGADLLGHLSRADTAESEEEVVGFLRAFLIWLLDQARRLPGTNLSSGAVLSIFLTVVSLIYGQHLSNETDQKVKEAKEGIMQEVRGAESRLIEELKSLRSKGGTSSQKEYVVVKNARLRQGPGKDFESFRTLPPNLVVGEIEREGGWSHVEFFDYVEGEHRDGWISTKLLIEKPADEESVP